MKYTEQEKALELKDKFGKLSNTVIDEMLDNTNECRSRYRTDYDRVCIRQYWIGVRDELNALQHPTKQTSVDSEPIASTIPLSDNDC